MRRCPVVAGRQRDHSCGLPVPPMTMSPTRPVYRSAYAQVAQILADESIDFALVDGVYRDHVALFLLPKISPGGCSIIDNVNWFLPSLTTIPASVRPSAGSRDRDMGGGGRGHSRSGAGSGRAAAYGIRRSSLRLLAGSGR